MMRQITFRQFQTTAGDLEKIRKVAGNPELREDEVFNFPTFLIARNGKNANKTEITSDGQKAAVALWVGKSILYRAHERETENQVGRIYDAWIEERDGETMTYGKAYDIKATDPAGVDLQGRIANRIHQEMSPGYWSVRSECSICGADTLRGHCARHVNEPDYCRRDFEFTPDHLSFTADPAIEGAGLITNSRQDEPDPALQRLADDGKILREYVGKEFSRFYRLNKPGATPEEITSLMDRLSAREMMTFARIQETQFREVIPSGQQQLQAPAESTEAETRSPEEIRQSFKKGL